MSKNTAAIVVANFIRDHELYGFESLSDETKSKLLTTFGFDFPIFVSCSLRTYEEVC